MVFRLNQLDARFDRLDQRLEAMPDRFAATIGVATEQMGKHIEAIEGITRANASRLSELEKWQATMRGGMNASSRFMTAGLALTCAIVGALATKLLGG